MKELIRKGALVDICRIILPIFIISILMLIINQEYTIIECIMIGSLSVHLHKILGYLYRFVFAASEAKKFLDMFGGKK